MTYMPDTPNMVRYYCPGCEIDADPLKEMLEARWCGEHSPSTAGEMDRLVDQSSYISGSNEAEGVYNAAMCNLIHRPKPLRS